MEFLLALHEVDACDSISFWRNKLAFSSVLFDIIKRIIEVSRVILFHHVACSHEISKGDYYILIKTSCGFKACLQPSLVSSAEARNTLPPRATDIRLQPSVTTDIAESCFARLVLHLSMSLKAWSPAPLPLHLCVYCQAYVVLITPKKTLWVETVQNNSCILLTYQ